MPEAASEAWYRDALALYERGDLEPAALLFERVLAISPENVEARYKLGNVRKEQGAWDAAKTHYAEVLRLAPGHAEAMNNLGAICQIRELPVEAEQWYRQAMDAKPALAQPYINLGRHLQSAGRDADAARVYEQALANNCAVAVFGHLRDAASGAASARAPQAYVRETFDAFASDFDRRLREDLDYRVPERLAVLVHEKIGDQSMDVLDLGCGTGLVADVLPPAHSLVGVDLSVRMLEVAHRKGRYQALHEADITTWMADQQAHSFDCVIAADVFIYLGELDVVFREVSRCLRPGGMFAFSVETCEGAEFRLLPSGRYAQSLDYLQTLAARSGFALLTHEAAVIRRGVEGRLFLYLRAGEAVLT